MKLLTGSFFSGTSGLVLPVPNKSHYPDDFKDKSRLCYYASLFNSIEVTSSFYKIPRAKTVAKWAGEVAESFKFTFKLWRGITHEKGLIFNVGDVVRFMQAVNFAKDKEGCLLIQFPPSVRSNLMPQLQQLIYAILQADINHKWKLALEFRHVSWYNDQLSLFAQNQNLTVVIHDMPASATSLNYTTNNIIYLRFHGPNGKYSGSYTNDILQEYSSYIYEWQAEGKTVYAYFNNTMGDAVKNLTTINQSVLLNVG